MLDTSLSINPPPISCAPPFWAKGAHAQTLLGNFLPSKLQDPPWEPLNLKLKDGDTLRMRLIRGTSNTVVHLFHGLGGSANSAYMRRAAELFWRQGHSVLANNHRGSGEGRGQAVKPYHMGSTSDLSAMIQVGRGFFPEALHVAVGFSLSAGVLLLLLGRDQDLGDLPDMAIAVNPPVDLEKVSLRLCQGFNRVYDLHFVDTLRRCVRERWEFGLLDHPIHIPKKATLRDFDAIYTAPAAGFQDREDYYARCSCAPYLRYIQAPTVILTSKDDPFASAQDLDGVELSPSVHLHIAPTGGHMGYLSLGVPKRRWLDYALDHYVRELVATSAHLVHSSSCVCPG